MVDPADGLDTLKKGMYMEYGPGGDVISRHPSNPLIGLEDIPFRCSDIWNAGVARHNGRWLLLISIEELEGRHAIYLAASDDGVHFTVEPTPIMAPIADGPDHAYESLGIRDPRITPVDGTYYITYMAEGEHGLRQGLAKTDDFKRIERIGYISQVDVKSGALFPQKIDDQYVVLSRPDAGNSIWLSRSPDLTFWGGHTVVMTPRGGYWDANRIGTAAPPIRVDAGWLLIYYGAKSTSAGPLVRLGAAVLDATDPSKVIARSNIPILAPREKFERIGDVPNVVFSCGAILEGNELVVYYGASDSCICRGTAQLKNVLNACFAGERGS